ncbi:transposable element Tcb1 transposase [Trichonephila clavipes]|nr:transposable element Tcb1 transposase [Trichonephila clavipes]
MEVTDPLVISRTVAKRIESNARFSVYAYHSTPFTAERYSIRRPLLGVPLMQNHRRLHRQWCDERRMWVAKWNEVVFTNVSGICLKHHDGRISLEKPWREDAKQLRYASLQWSCIVYYGMRWYWMPISHPSSTHCGYFKQLELLLRGVGVGCTSLHSGLGHSHISTG